MKMCYNTGSFVVFLFCVSLSSVYGGVKHSLSSQEIEAMIGDLDFSLGIFCAHDDASEDECEEYVTEVGKLFTDGQSTFTGLQAAVIGQGDLARKYGVEYFPALVFFRKSSPIFYTGSEINYKEIYVWMEQHRKPIVHELTDSNFEHDTQAASGSTTGIWLIHFYEPRCSQANNHLETLASVMRQDRVVGKIDLSANPGVKERFAFEKCATMAVFHNGKMYRFKEEEMKYNSLVSFARLGFSMAEAEVIAPEPQVGFMVMLFSLLKDSLLGRFLIIGGGSLMVLMIVMVTLKKRRNRRSKFD